MPHPDKKRVGRVSLLQRQGPDAMKRARDTSRSIMQQSGVSNQNLHQQARLNIGITDKQKNIDKLLQLYSGDEEKVREELNLSDSYILDRWERQAFEKVLQQKLAEEESDTPVEVKSPNDPAPNPYNGWPILEQLERMSPSYAAPGPNLMKNPEATPKRKRWWGTADSWDPTLGLRQKLTKTRFFSPELAESRKAHAKEEAEIYGRMFDESFQPFDVFGETVFDTFKMGGKVVKNILTGERGESYRKDVKLPRIIDPNYGQDEARLAKVEFDKQRGVTTPDIDFTERANKIAEEFHKRPFSEQIAIGILDPFIVFSIGKFALRALPKIAVRMFGREASDIEIAKAVKAIEVEKVAASTSLPALPSTEELTALINPRRASSYRSDKKRGPIARFVGDWWDESAKIPELEEGSDYRIALTSKNNYVRAIEFGKSVSQTMMAKLDHRANSRWGAKNEGDIFGWKSGEIRATKVTQGRKHLATDVEEAQSAWKQRQVHRISKTAIESRSKRLIVSEETPLGYPAITPSGPQATTRSLAVRRGDAAAETIVRVSAEPVVVKGQARSKALGKKQFQITFTGPGTTRPLSKAAQNLLKSAARGNAPTSITTNLRNIARAHNIQIYPSTTPDIIIKQLQDFQVQGGATATVHHLSMPELAEVAETLTEQLGADILTGIRLGPGKKATYTKGEIKAVVDSINLKTPPKASDEIYELTETPIFNNVFENQGDYVLTPAMQDMARFRGEIIKDLLRLMKAEGVDPRELNAFDEAFTYGPRYVYDSRGNKLIQTSASSGGRGSLKETRFHQFMEKELLDSGGKYADPTASLDIYIRGAYAEMAHARRLDSIRPLARSTAIPQKLIDAANILKTKIKRMDQRIGQIPLMRHGYIPTGATRASMKRLFPELTDEIDEVMALSPASADEIIRTIGQDVFTIAKVDSRKFREALLKVQEEDGLILGARDIAALEGEKLTGKYGRVNYNDGGGVREALKLMRLETQQETAVYLAAQRATEALLTDVRKVKIDALATRMQSSRAGAQILSATANRTVKEAKTMAGRGATESTVTRLAPGLVFDAERAAMLEKVFVEEGTTVWTKASKVSGVLRKFKTVYDVGGPLLHGLPMLYNDPQGWGRATAMHLKQLIDPSIRSKYIAENSEEIIEFLRYGGTMGSSEFTQSLTNGGWFAALPTTITNSGRVPERLKPIAAGIPRTISISSERFSNSFELFLDAARIETWKGLRGSIQPDELPELASFVNKITGTSSSKVVGVPLSHQEFESAIVFFAPRYFRSISAVMLDTMSGGMRGQLARKSIGSLLTGLVLTHVAVQQFMDQPIHLDPTDPYNFLSTEIAGQNIRPGGKVLSFIKALSNIITKGAENPMGFLNWDILDPEVYDENPLLAMARYQASPGTTNVLNIASGSDPMGRNMPDLHPQRLNPKEIGLYGLEQVSPFWFDAAVDSMLAEHELTGTIIGSGLEFTGGMSGPVPFYRKLQAKLNEKAVEKYGMTWDELTDPKNRNRGGSSTNGQFERRELYAEYPELVEMHKKVAEHRNKNVKYQDEKEILRIRDRISLEWYDYMEQAGDNYWRLGGDGRTKSTKLKSDIKEAARSKQDQNRHIREDFPEITRLQEEHYQKLAEDWPMMAAQNNYFDKLTSTISMGGVLNDKSLEVDYGEMDKLKDSIKVKYGEEMMGLINEELTHKRARYVSSTGKQRELHAVVAEYFDSISLLQPYWETYKEIVPEEHWGKWNEYQAAPNRQEQNRIATTYGLPLYLWQSKVDFSKQKMAFNDNEVDMALHLFHGRTPKNPDNINQLRGEAMKELGRRNTLYSSKK